MITQTPNIFTPVRYLKGVGPKRAELLTKLGVNTVEDLMYYLPRRYEDRTRFTSIRALKAGESACVRAKIVSNSIYTTKKGIPVLQIRIYDGTGSLYCVWFNMPFMKKNFVVGSDIIVYGRFDVFDKPQMSHPDYEIIKPDRGGSVNMGRIVPVYPLTKDISARYLRTLVMGTVTGYSEHINETLPDYVIEKEELCDLKSAVRNIHFPQNFDELGRAYRRLVFEEFLLLQLALLKKKMAQTSRKEGVRHDTSETMLEEFKKLLPFELTDGQLKAIGDVERDMVSGKPMNRLLQGDVGSGKTVVALYALILTVNNAHQGVIMAPTEILARQHFMTISEVLMPMGINVGLLVSGIDKDKKDALKADIRNGAVDIVVGTHAILEEDVSFKDLGLIVIDEQHKFGVNQRGLLKFKGSDPHMLVMTATPIPRTLALTVYGDLDMSVIKERPKGRKPVTTAWIDENKRQDLYRFMREQLSSGRQAYMVYPRVSSDPASDLRSAESMYAVVQERIFPEFKVGLIHGRMEPVQKESIMKKFKEKKFDILVSTIVIEVGIDVPNAAVMVIENAERFGLSQLHQLRGRIGRGTHESYCVLMGDASGEDAHRRFGTMIETQDGFEIAEEDLELRGPGQFFGTRQHGIPELRFGNLVKDFEIMEAARRAASEIIAGDPTLADMKNYMLKRGMLRRFAEAIR